MGAGIRLAHEAGMIGEGNIPSSQGASHELQKLRDLRREINESYRADARSESLREAVIHAANALAPIRIEPLPLLTAMKGKSLLLA